MTAGSPSSPVPAEASIEVGDGRVVGVIRVDPATMRAVKSRAETGSRFQRLQRPGAPHEAGQRRPTTGTSRPHLVIPVEVVMRNRPAGSTLALVGLAADLTFAQGDNVWRSAPLDLIEGMPCRSFPAGKSSTTLALRFALGAAAISALERARQDNMGSTASTAGEPFRLVLEFSGRVAGLTTIGDMAMTADSADDPFHNDLGTHSQLSMFWSTRIEAATFEVDHTVWLKAVIPAFKSALRRGR
jgi:hypothetical protein